MIFKPVAIGLFHPEFKSRFGVGHADAEDGG